MLKIIAVFVAIYVFFRIMTGIVIPWILKRHLNRFKSKYHQNNNNSATTKSKHYKKGDVHIVMKEKQTKKPDSDNIGEYVDFEEIKDKHK